jgi:NAD(P)-dependent dehydrogenase (short-subunit alcohol dehydrogenase family)
VIAQWGANHPLGRVGTPAEVADAILFLASPLSGFVTGTELRVDGGLLAAVAVAAPGSAAPESAAPESAAPETR